MRILLFGLFLLVASGTASGAELVYEGGWVTTNRKLDGSMTAELTPVTKHEWRGRFHGVWQGVPIDYTVAFRGPPDDLRGSATIDGAAYEWRGWITRQQFKANFGGDRYQGSFDLKRKSPEVARRPQPRLR